MNVHKIPNTKRTDHYQFDKSSNNSFKSTNALSGYAGRSIQDNKISVIQGSRSKGFDKIKALKESINEIRHSYSEEVGKSTFEQILGISDAKDIPESMKNLALNKQGSWSNQAITLGVKKELAALFIAEKGSEAFYPKPLKGETVCNLDIGKFRTWFFEKFKSLTNDKNQGSKYNDDLIKDVWQHVSHETDCFGKFNGLNDITYNRNTQYVSFGKEYNYTEKIDNLVLSDDESTKDGLAAVLATFNDKSIFELKSTPRLSIITNEETKNPENIVYVRPKGSDVFKEIKSKEMLPESLKYIEYCSAESATDVSLLKTLARASLLPQEKHTENSVTAYFLDEGSDPATLSIKCVTEFSPNKNCKDQFKISIFAHKTVDLTTRKILNYAVNVESNNKTREAPYNFWTDKLKEEWQKKLDQHQDDPKIISGEESILEVYNPKTKKAYSISAWIEDENKLGITIDKFESADKATNLFVAKNKLSNGTLDQNAVSYFKKYLDHKFTTLTAGSSSLKQVPRKENDPISFEIQGLDNKYLASLPYMYQSVFGELPAIDNALDISNNSRKSVGSMQSSPKVK